jgi:hypothetical protein
MSTSVRRLGPRRARATGTNTRQQSPEISEVGRQLADQLRNLILTNNLSAKITPGQVAKWGHEADLMIRVDNRTQEGIRLVMEWSQRDSFWRANILSMAKLREKFDQLWMQMQRGGRNGSQDVKQRRCERFAVIDRALGGSPASEDSD